MKRRFWAGLLSFVMLWSLAARQRTGDRGGYAGAG